MRAHEFIAETINPYNVEDIFEQLKQSLVEDVLDKNEFLRTIVQDPNLMTPTPDNYGKQCFPVQINMIVGEFAIISIAHFDNEVEFLKKDYEFMYFKNPVTNNIKRFPKNDNIGVRLLYKNKQSFTTVDTMIDLKYGFDKENHISHNLIDNVT